VVLGGTTWTLVRGAFETEPLDTQGSRALAGGQHVEAWRVLRERKAATRFERVLATGNITRMVGRERELQTLLGRWAEAREGRGSFVLVSGEAGIGKSRLIQELLGRVSPEPTFLLQGQCWAQLGSSAFSPVIDMLWRFLQIEPRALPRRELRGQLESRLEALGLLGEPGLEARHVDGLMTLLSPAIPEETPPMALALEGKRRTFDALRALLSRMTERRPVLAVVEDLHWADPSTLELLGGLLDSTGRERLLVVLSARTGFPPPWPSQSRFHWLELGRLSAEATALLVREVARGRELPEERVAQLVAKTDGIPLFIEEMTRLVLDRAPASIPATLHELLASRLDALPPRQRALIWFGAGVGPRFTRALLAALTRRSEAELRGDLAELVAVGVLQQDDSAEPGYQFHHALLQEVAWGSLPRGRRREFHRHIAQVLEARFPDLVDTRPEVLAHHYTEAGEQERALHYRTLAAELALQRWAYLEEITHLKQALALLRGLPDASPRSGEEMRLLNALGIALMNTQGYSVPEIEQIYARALELFAQKGESLPYLDLLWLWLCFYFITGGRLPLALDLAERLVALGQKRGDKSLCAHGYRSLSLIYRERGELVRSLELLNRASALSMDEPDAGFSLSSLWIDQEVYDSTLISIVRLVLGDEQRAWQCGLEALARAKRLNHPATLAVTLTYLAGAAQIQRDTQRTLEWAEEGMLVAAKVWFRPPEEAARVLRGWALARLGRRQEGLEVLRASLEQLRRMGVWIYVPYFQGLFAEVQGSLGQVREGLASVEEALEEMEERGIHFLEPELHRIRGELLRPLGAHGEAMRCFLRARIVARRQQAELLEMRATVALARLLRDLGSEEQARRRLVRACHGSKVAPVAVDFQDARVLLEHLSILGETVASSPVAPVSSHQA
jgi:tetratricopeptide (TPR) repeat protein